MGESIQNPPDLLKIAYHAMLAQGLEAQFSEAAIHQLDGIRAAAAGSLASARDLTHLLWCSIDNDDSRDLDQVSVSEPAADGRVRILVGIADVDALVEKGSAIDRHASANTTSVYTVPKVFPMLPERLSTDLTSLSQDEERMALVIEMTVDPDGHVSSSDIYPAKIKNRSKLAYASVAAWLEGRGPLPPRAAAVPGMDEQLRTQDRVAQKMRLLRHEHGALELETLEPRAIMKDGTVVGLKNDLKNRAQELIEDFMVGANGVSARFLSERDYPTLRRVVRSPEKWGAIVKLAEGLGEKLPSSPDAKALAEFLSRERQRDPLRFPDLSLSVVKLLGAGEYVLEVPGQAPLGHFGLAVSDYSHSTAPNRRFPDLLTQRLLKAAIAKRPPPYGMDELTALAFHCTQMEDSAAKVERQVRKSAAASLISNRIGDRFDAIVTGASEKGTWVRVLEPPVEGKVLRGFQGLQVGDRTRVQLLGVHVEKGWIDFAVSQDSGKP